MEKIIIDDSIKITVEHYGRKAVFEDAAGIGIEDMARLLNAVLVWIGYAPESIKDVLAYGDGSYTVWDDQRRWNDR